MNFEKTQKKVLTRGIWTLIWAMFMPPIGLFTGIGGMRLSKKYFRDGGPKEGRVITGRVLSIVGFWVDIFLTISYTIMLVSLYTMGYFG